jgi:hypothetical protein
MRASIARRAEVFYDEKQTMQMHTCTQQLIMAPDIPPDNIDARGEGRLPSFDLSGGTTIAMGP